ncbi:MAG: hypothetical protein ACRDHP_03790 [Ktedonobacterales bacterium]
MMNNNADDIGNVPDLSPNWDSIPIGTTVFTIDGRQLGAVKERREDGLLVAGNDPSDQEYLVTAQDVSRIEQDGVHLMVSESQAMRATSSSEEGAAGANPLGTTSPENPPPTQP